jgi:Ca2+-binding EF-hand superfamily protein
VPRIVPSEGGSPLRREANKGVEFKEEDLRAGVEKMFAEFDPEKKGYITRDHLREIILRSGGNQAVSDKQVNIFMSALNSNTKEEVTVDEMYDFYRKFYFS